MPDSQPIGGGSRLLGVNQLQTSIDSLTSAVQGLSAKMGASQAWTGSGATFSSGPTLNQTAAGGSNGGGPSVGGPAATLNQVSSGGNGGWRSVAMGAASGFAASNAMGAMQGVANYGSGQLGTMAGISAYTQQGGLFGGANNYLLNSAGFGTTLNDIANSANDAAQGQAFLNYASGSWASPNALSRSMGGAANMVGMLNPTLGYTGSAQLAQQLYSQQMSMQMMAMGYGLTPRTMRGGANSISAVNEAIMARTFGGKGHVSQAAFNASAAVGGRLNYNLQGMGLSGSATTQMLTMLSAQNKLENAGFSQSQIQGIFNGAAKGNQASLADLNKAGINASSVVQTMKNKTAVSTQRSGEEETGFSAGLRDSVGLLNKFNSAINKMLQGPLGHFIGYGAGAGAGASGIMGRASSAISDFSSGNFAGGISSIVGGGAAATGGSSTLASKGGSRLTTAVSGAAKSAVGWAEQELGVPYMWGGEQPGVGFDCSGLTQWAYGKAGVKIPRTSQQQWAALGRGHSVGLNQVQAGDLVFTAGSDGTPDSPGHVAMMINNRQLIQAEQTGTNIMITPYNPKQWQHAARPTGPGTAGMGPGGPGAGPASSGVGMASGFGGGYAEGGAMGSQNEIDAISGAVSGGGFMSGFLGQSGFTGPSGTGNPGGGAPSAGNVSGNAALAKKMAAKRGWTGALWNDLNALEMREAGWNVRAQNPNSKAYGIAQFINGASEYYQYGGNPNTAAGQITGFLNYITDRYKTPASAWQHEQQFNWYAGGTQNASRGMAIVGENGPEAISLSGGQTIMTAGQTAGLLAQIQSGQGGKPGGGMNLVVQVSPGAITVQGGIGSGSDVSSSAREIASQLGQYLEQESIIQKLAAGVS